MRSAERIKVNILEISVLVVWLECHEWIELASRADQSVLRWFGHVESMDEYRMARMVLMAEVSEGRVRGRLGGWCGGSLWHPRNDCGGCAKDRKE